MLHWLQLAQAFGVVGAVAFPKKLKFDMLFSTVSEMTTIKNFLEGERIYQAGESSRGAYIIETGWVNLYTDMEFHLVTLGEGELFGELGQIIDDQRSVTAIAKTDCQLKHIPQYILDDKFNAADPAIVGMFRAQAIRLRKANEQKVQMWSKIESLRAKMKALEAELDKM